MTKKQKLFVEEYLIDLNATQAAIRAGYSAKTAQEQASRLLSNVMVQGSIAKAMAERSKRTGINQDRVIQELARIAFVNPQNVIDSEDASVREDATEDDLACIQSVKVKTMSGEKGSSVEREVRLNDKMKALELLGKHLGMFKDKLELETDMDLNITIDYGKDDTG
ncbi:MAG: terminase small subunit [Blautia sp.]|nr:terminase small subunit [Blautia sp.]